MRSHDAHAHTPNSAAAVPPLSATSAQPYTPSSGPTSGPASGTPAERNAWLLDSDSEGETDAPLPASNTMNDWAGQATWVDALPSVAAAGSDFPSVWQMTDSDRQRAEDVAKRTQCAVGALPGGVGAYDSASSDVPRPSRSQAASAPGGAPQANNGGRDDAALQAMLRSHAPANDVAQLHVPAPKGRAAAPPGGGGGFRVVRLGDDGVPPPARVRSGLEERIRLGLQNVSSATTAIDDMFERIEAFAVSVIERTATAAQLAAAASIVASAPLQCSSARPPPLPPPPHPPHSPPVHGMAAMSLGSYDGDSRSFPGTPPQHTMPHRQARQHSQHSPHGYAYALPSQLYRSNSGSVSGYGTPPARGPPPYDPQSGRVGAFDAPPTPHGPHGPISPFSHSRHSAEQHADHRGHFPGTPPRTHHFGTHTVQSGPWSGPHSGPASAPHPSMGPTSGGMGAGSGALARGGHERHGSGMLTQEALEQRLQRIPSTVFPECPFCTVLSNSTQSLLAHLRSKGASRSHALLCPRLLQLACGPLLHCVRIFTESRPLPRDRSSTQVRLGLTHRCHSCRPPPQGGAPRAAHLRGSAGLIRRGHAGGAAARNAASRSAASACAASACAAAATAREARLADGSRGGAGGGGARRDAAAACAQAAGRAARRRSDKQGCAAAALPARAVAAAQGREVQGGARRLACWLHHLGLVQICFQPHAAGLLAVRPRYSIAIGSSPHIDHLRVQGLPRASKRCLAGMKEVSWAVGKPGRTKLVLLAPNIQIPSPDSVLLTQVLELVRKCREADVPIIMGPSRKHLGMAFRTSGARRLCS